MQQTWLQLWTHVHTLGGGESGRLQVLNQGHFVGFKLGLNSIPTPTPPALHSHTALLHLLLAFPASQLPATHAAVLLQQLMSEPEHELTDMHPMRCEELRAELKTKGMKALSDVFHADDLFSS